MENNNKIKLTKYVYLDKNNEEKHYFIGTEILLGYKNAPQAIQLNISEENKISFKNYLGVKEPKINSKKILINKNGINELVNITKVRKFLEGKKDTNNFEWKFKEIL